MESNDEWTPDDASVKWSQRLLDSMDDGGLWVVPANGAVYIVDKSRRQLRLINGITSHPHDRIILAFGELGYEVVESLNPTPLPILEQENNKTELTDLFDMDDS